FYLVTTLVVLVGALAATFAAGNEPVLGLDLQGGISIVYQPVGKFTSAGLDEAVNIIQNRVNGLGVAEPDINRQGNTISVDLPGVKHGAKASRIVGKTAELRFRPVLAQLPAANVKIPTSSTSTTGAESTTTTTAAQDQAVKAAITACDANQVQTLLAAGV